MGVAGAGEEANDDGYWKAFVDALEPDDKSIQFYRDQFCNIALLSGGFMNNCQVWTYLLYGSWMLAASLVCTIIFLLTGAGLLFAPPTRCVRLTALGMFAVAAAANVGGLA